MLKCCCSERPNTLEHKISPNDVKAPSIGLGNDQLLIETSRKDSAQKTNQKEKVASAGEQAAAKPSSNEVAPPNSTLAPPQQQQQQKTKPPLTQEEKEREKARLQKLVKEFAKDAVQGVELSLIGDAGKRETATFSMDRYLTVVTLTQPPGASGQKTELQMKDIISIFKGTDSARQNLTQSQRRIDGLGEDVADNTVGLEVSRPDGNKTKTLFYFADVYSRDKFYTCLKILRMSVDINRGAPAPAPSAAAK